MTSVIHPRCCLRTRVNAPNKNHGVLFFRPILRVGPLDPPVVPPPWTARGRERRGRGWGRDGHRRFGAGTRQGYHGAAAEEEKRDEEQRHEPKRAWLQAGQNGVRREHPMRTSSTAVIATSFTVCSEEAERRRRGGGRPERQSCWMLRKSKDFLPLQG